MAILTREDLRKQLQDAARSHPSTCFSAPESYLRDLAVKTICDLSFATDEARDFNETEFSLNTAGNLAAALAAAEQLPMMASGGSYE